MLAANRAIKAGQRAASGRFAIEIKLCGTFKYKESFVAGMFMGCMCCLSWANNAHFYGQIVLQELLFNKPLLVSDSGFYCFIHVKLIDTVFEGVLFASLLRFLSYRNTDEGKHKQNGDDNFVVHRFIVSGYFKCSGAEDIHFLLKLLLPMLFNN